MNGLYEEPNYLAMPSGSPITCEWLNSSGTTSVYVNEYIVESPQSKIIYGNISLKDAKKSAKLGFTERQDGIYLGEVKLIDKIMIIR